MRLVGIEQLNSYNKTNKARPTNKQNQQKQSNKSNSNYLMNPFVAASRNIWDARDIANLCIFMHTLDAVIFMHRLDAL